MLDRTTRQAWRKTGEPVALTMREYELLVLFALNAGRALTRGYIFEHVLGLGERGGLGGDQGLRELRPHQTERGRQTRSHPCRARHRLYAEAIVAFRDDPPWYSPGVPARAFGQEKPADAYVRRMHRNGFALRRGALIIDVAMLTIHHMMDEDSGTCKVLKSVCRSFGLLTSHYPRHWRSEPAGHFRGHEDGEMPGMFLQRALHGLLIPGNGFPLSLGVGMHDDHDRARSKP